MDIRNEKCVLVLDAELPLGLLANTAAILGVTLGSKLPEIVGPDVYDGEGQKHLGIVTIPVPVLAGSKMLLVEIRRRLNEEEFAGITAVNFSDLAQSCKTYDEFLNKMRAADGNALNYFGLLLCGGKKQINRLTGNLPLLR